MSKVRLGDYVRIKTGKLDANAASPDGDYPFFTCAVEPLKIDSYSYDCECVLVAGNCDLNVKYYDGKFDAYQRTYIIESKDNTRLSVPYLYRFLDAYIDTLRNQSIGGVIKYIKLGNLTEARINVPAISEQNKTVKILSFVDELLKKANLQLQKLDELIKSRFVEMFGDLSTNSKAWSIVPLEEVAEIRIGPFGSLLHKEDYICNGHALVNPSHIIDSRIIPDVKLTISDTKYHEMLAYHLRKDDIVLGRRGEMGRCAVVQEKGLLCGTGSMIIRPNGKLKSFFLQTILSSPLYKKILKDKAVGVTMLNLNVPIVSSVAIPLLPVDLQDEFIALLQTVEQQKATVQKSIDKLETLKKSLMQEYFG